MKKKEFKNLPDTDTPINAENLNEMQDNIEESAVVVSAIQPTTNEKVWLQRSNNLFNKELANMQNKGFSSAEGNVTAETNQSRMTTVNTIRLKAGTYTISFINAGKIWILAYDLLGNYKGNGYIQSSWETTNSKTFTLEEECLIRISIANVDDSEISLDEIYNIQIERGSTATTYEEYIEPKIYVKNDNGVFEEFYQEKKEVILYSNSNGTQDAITLNDSYTKYSKIRVLFGISWLKKYVEIDVSKGNNIPLELSYGLTNGTQFQTNIAILNLKDSTASFIDSRTYTCVFSTSSYSQNTTNSLYVYEIVGIE